MKSTLQRFWDNQDAAFFKQHLDRRAHIRKAVKDECAGEFWSLGPHDPRRRHVILWRVPEDNPRFNPDRQEILKIPYLLFGDETVEDRDDILLPIIHYEMLKARQAHGL